MYNTILFVIVAHAYFLQRTSDLFNIYRFIRGVLEIYIFVAKGLIKNTRVMLYLSSENHSNFLNRTIIYTHITC